MEEWNRTDVQRWLEFIDFPEYKECWMEKRVSGRTLKQMHDHDTCTQFGVTKLAHRKRLLALREELLLPQHERLSNKGEAPLFDSAAELTFGVMQGWHIGLSSTR